MFLLSYSRVKQSGRTRIQLGMLGSSHGQKHWSDCVEASRALSDKEAHTPLRLPPGNRLTYRPGRGKGQWPRLQGSAQSRRKGNVFVRFLELR
uniref:Uncharacterized protein n=1 Tax=Sphaerodactylus townsendi TaxID=933632 RepID=A0ACB8EKH5_9SAUR